MQPDILPGQYFVLLKGNGATPTEAFTAVCGITTKNFTGQINTNDNFVADCDNPTDVPIRRVTATGKQFDLSAEGLMNRSNVQDMWNALGTFGNWRLAYTEPENDEVFQGYWQGRFLMNNFQLGAPQGENTTLSLQFLSDGDVALTEVTPT